MQSWYFLENDCGKLIGYLVLGRAAAYAANLCPESSG